MKVYWCSSCGMTVTEKTVKCPRCKVRLSGVRDGNFFDKARLSRQYNIAQFKNSIDLIIYYLDEYWFLILSTTSSENSFVVLFSFPLKVSSGSSNNLPLSL